MKTLRQYRKGKNLSQIALAKELIKLGLSIGPSSIAMYELGKRKPPLEKAKSIAKFFGVSTDDIFWPGCSLSERNPPEQKGSNGGK